MRLYLNLIAMTIATLAVLAACVSPTVPTPPSASTVAPVATVSPADDDANVVADLGIHPDQIGLDTQGLPYAWQANAVAGTPYDASQPPGPMGLPDHIQINFGGTDPTQVQPQDPILYIIPVTPYQELWETAGSTSVTDMVNAIYRQMVTNPNPAPISGLPVLPYEQAVGVNDIAVQVARPVPTDVSAGKDGYRFVGRFEQSPNPVVNNGMRYIHQGFTNDGKYLVLFFYPPVTTAQLPDSAAEVPQTEMDQVNTDPSTYLTAKAAELNALPASAWEPDLATLDALVSSLTISNMTPNGLEGQVWQLAGTYDGQQETPLENTTGYTVTFLNGELTYQADCNSGQGVYTISDGGMVGNLRSDLGEVTLTECGPGSYSNELVGTLQSAQNYKVRPGGQMLELVRPAGGGSLLFSTVGPSEGAPTAP